MTVSFLVHPSWFFCSNLVRRQNALPVAADQAGRQKSGLTKRTYRLPCLTSIKDVLRSRDVFLYHLRSSPYFVFLCLSQIERTQIIGVTMSQQHNEEVIGKSEIVHIKYSASRDADQLSINEVALGDNLPQGYYYSLPFIGTLLVS